MQIYWIMKKNEYHLVPNCEGPNSSRIPFKEDFEYRFLTRSVRKGVSINVVEHKTRELHHHHSEDYHVSYLRQRRKLCECGVGWHI